VISNHNFLILFSPFEPFPNHSSRRKRHNNIMFWALVCLLFVVQDFSMFVNASACNLCSEEVGCNAVVILSETDECTLPLYVCPSNYPYVWTAAAEGDDLAHKGCYKTAAQQAAGTGPVNSWCVFSKYKDETDIATKLAAGGSICDDGTIYFRTLTLDTLTSSLTLSVTSSQSTSATSTTLTHVASTRDLVVGDVVTVTGHMGNAANLAMNQAFTVASVTSSTEAVLTGTGMTIGTYSAGTISGATGFFTIPGKFFV